jgi:hypothetical protein
MLSCIVKSRSCLGSTRCLLVFAPVIALDIMLRVNVQAYLVEAGNVRHEHEYKVWRDVKLPAGKILIPGVVSHSTDIVGHPELVADRIVAFAEIVGRRKCHRRHRLRPRRPRPSPDRVGQAARAARRRGDREQEAVELRLRRIRRIVTIERSDSR